MSENQSTYNSLEKRELVINGLDFDQIKNNLKTFLRSQQEFKDYNFEASSINILLDILAYNTHYNAFYSNMLINESFLDTAVLRDSVVSLAKHIGYTPRSDQGAECLVDVQLIPSNAEERNDLIRAVNTRTLKVSKYETFKTSTSNTGSTRTLYFYCTNDVEFQLEVNSGITEFWARNVRLREGNVRVASFVVDSANPTQRFILPESNVDSRSIELRVQRSSTSLEGLNEIWFKDTNFNDIKSDTNVFFIQEVYGGKYEIYFGDGILGRKPNHGNLISVVYSITKGSAGNQIGINETLSNFTFSYSGSSISRVYVSKDSDGNPIPTSGGSEKETVESIKFYAPRKYASQDRAVTLEDYVNFLSGFYSDSFKSVYAWGGEDNDPPEYGKVFISVRPKASTKLSLSEKQNIEQNLLKSRNMVSITPRVVDPDYLYIIPSISVKYKNSELEITPEALRSRILTAVFLYNENNLSVFDRNFYSSDLMNNILDVHPAIKSCNISIDLKKYVAPSLNRKFTYKIDFQNPLVKLSERNHYIESSFFNTKDINEDFVVLNKTFGFVRDDGLSTIKTYKRSIDESLVIINDNQGVIDASTGKITLSNLFVYPQEFGSPSVFSLIAKPKDMDIISRKNLILEIEMPSVSLNLTRV